MNQPLQTIPSSYGAGAGVSLAQRNRVLRNT